MNLTSFLKIEGVKSSFSKAFPLPHFLVKKPILAPPLTTHYSMIGTAFDYLMRFYLEKINTNPITHRWVAEEAVNLTKLSFPESFEKTDILLKNAKKSYLNYKKSGILTDDIIKSSIHLAQLDPIFRASFIDSNIGLIENDDIVDLKNLISIVDSTVFTAKNICILNPTFGEGSQLVGGADSDILIDGTLIDIKTIKNLELGRNHFNQLIGYYILFEIGGIDGLPRNQKIENLGIYFSRYGFLYTFPVKNITENPNFSSFVDWFEKTAKKVFPQSNFL